MKPSDETVLATLYIVMMVLGLLGAANLYFWWNSNPGHLKGCLFALFSCVWVLGYGLRGLERIHHAKSSKANRGTKAPR